MGEQAARFSDGMDDGVGSARVATPPWA